MSLSYEHEDTDQARQGRGDEAPNPAQEVVNFDTLVASLRVGVTEKLNLVATIPWYSIDSRKIQGAPYTRLNRGVGDLTVEAELSVLDSPQVTLSTGVKFATGSVDKTDEFGQRICDILALGSGTTDLLVGGGIWVPHAGIDELSLFANARHRFVSGPNKWGYEFGDQTTFRVRTDYPLFESGSVGLAIDGFHSDKDLWYGNVVPERGATFVFVGPTVAWNVTDQVSLGAFLRFPAYMDLEGSQMVAPSTFGMDLTTNVTDFVHGLLSPLGVGE